jgi:hypothetical protein
VREELEELSEAIVDFLGLVRRSFGEGALIVGEAKYVAEWGVNEKERELVGPGTRVIDDL